jgi:hypothetical protein
MPAAWMTIFQCDQNRAKPRQARARIAKATKSKPIAEKFFSAGVAVIL